jgi:hypothetical protein
MKNHNLKTIQPYFDQVESGEKTFELRMDDRDFQVGDTLTLLEYNGSFTGRKCERTITHVLRNAPHFGLMDNHAQTCGPPKIRRRKTPSSDHELRS